MEIGDPNVQGSGADASLVIGTAGAVSLPNALIANMSGADGGQAASIARNFSTTLGTLTSIAVDADFSCTVPLQEFPGAPVGLAFYDDGTSMNGHQVLASLYADHISFDEGLILNGTLSGTGDGNQLPFDCTTPPLHHITLAIAQSGASYVAKLTLDGMTTAPTTLSTGANGFAFSPYTFLQLAATNDFSGTPMNMVIDNVVVRTTQ